MKSILMISILVTLLACSCNVTKGKQTRRSTTDSTGMSAIDKSEGSRLTITGTSVEAAGYTKETVITPLLIKDTSNNVVNVYPTHTTVIHEQGQSVKEDEHSKVDEEWKREFQNALIQVATSKSESSKDKESKPATGFVMAIAACLGLVLIILVLVIVMVWKMKGKLVAMAAKFTT